MGFLKKLAAKGLGSVIGDDLADALIPDDIEKQVAKKASKKAVDAAVDAAVGASVEALVNRKKNSLATPPPPPGIPTMANSIRAMVAVNGQQYGPYEKAGLVNMINEGSLTKDTYVYVEGNTEWKFAKDVPEVNALFGTTSIPTPPMPFAPAPPVPGGNAAEKSSVGRDGLSDKLNSLIDAAVADGEISDLERQVLIRNAQEEKVPMDEFVVILEARLFEQRKRLEIEQKNLHNQAKQAEAAHKATASHNQPSKTNEVRKCPACGSVILSLTASRCNECGYEFADNDTTSSCRSFDDLMRRLDEEDRKFAQKNILNKFLSRDLDGSEKKAMIIRGYVLPTDKKNLVEFISSCKSCADGAQFGDIIGKAWKSKLQDAINTYQNRFGNDAEAMALIEIYVPKKIKKKLGIF